MGGMEIFRITSPSINENTGIVPPWLQDPITILPMPDDWSAPVLEGPVEIVEPATSLA